MANLIKNQSRQLLNQVNQQYIFKNKDVIQQVNILNNTLMYIFSNFVPNKVITIDDRDPPWMTDTIKFKIQWQNSVLKTAK